MKPDWPIAYSLQPHRYQDDQVCGHVCCHQYPEVMGGMMCGLTKEEHRELEK